MREDYTQKMKDLFEERSSNLKGLYCREEIAAVLEDVKRAPRDRIKFPMDMLKNMCEGAGVDANALLKDDTLLEKIPVREELKDQLLEIFHALYREAPGPQDYMERLVHRLAPEYREDPVRLAILKKFIIGSDKRFKALGLNAVYKWAQGKMDAVDVKRFKKLSPEEKSALVVSCLDDSIFTDEALNSASSGKWRILHVCNNLAGGRFLSNGGQTRVYLYYFAIMFDMTVELKNPKDRKDETDLQKNLFEDYYNDNLMRYLDDVYCQAEYASSFEKEPTGEGINYKNFAEVIYLYYLYRKDLPYRPGERIDRANEMIERCIERAVQEGMLVKDGIVPDKKAPSEIPEDQFTEVYRQRFAEELVNLPEERLPDAILRYYQLPDPDAGKNQLKIRVSSEENTAYDRMAELMEELDEGQEDVWRGQELLAEIEERSAAAAKDRNRQISVDEEEMQNQFGEELHDRTQPRFQNRLLELLRVKYADDEKFLGLVERLNDRITAEYARIGAGEYRLILYLLAVLRSEPDPQKPLRLDFILQRIRPQFETVSGEMIKQAAETLQKLGYTIKKTADPATKKSRYALTERIYEDHDLNELLREAKLAPLVREDAAMQLAKKMVKERIRVSKEISRSRLMVLVTGYYIELLNDTPDLQTFQEIYGDFADTVDLYLRDSRFQTFSEKNILDMYLLLSVYLYVIENGIDSEFGFIKP